MSASALRFPYALLKLGRRATDQQLWCLGCDVRVRDFPLSELGWRYHTRPDKSRGCGRLIGSLPSEGHLSMWGFGFLACDSTHGALWMDRKSFRPKWASGFAPNRVVFERKHLPDFSPPQSADRVDCVLFLVSELALRTAEHEEDVIALLGEDYRDRCLAEWQHGRHAIQPVEMPQVWREIAGAARDLRDRETSPSGKVRT